MNLQNQINNHNCVGCHILTHADYNTCKAESEEYQRIFTKLSGKVSDSELERLLNKAGDLTEKLKKKTINLGQEKIKTKKLTKIKKVGALLVEKLRSDLTDLKSEFSVAQNEISQLKQDNQNLEESKELIKKELQTEIKELKNNQKEQEQELNKQQTTIQQLQTEKTT